MAISRFSSLSSRFARQDGGNFSIAFAAIATTLTMSLGLAVNYAQLSQSHNNLLNALDSALVSTARDITTGLIKEKDAEKSVLAFLAANTRDGLAVASSIKLNSLQLDKTTKQLVGKASIDVPLVFPVFSTASTKRVTVESAAVYSDKSIEVAMMLDVTGSMSGQKIKDLKVAAANAVEAFLGTNQGVVPRVRVAIVPYADAVNVGPGLAGTVTALAGNAGEPAALDPIALAASGMIASSLPDMCATDRTGSEQFTDASPLVAMINRDSRLKFCPAAQLQPLTANKDELLDTIGAFTANGFTAGGIGVQWTRYMLSPEWKNVLPSDSAPTAYGSTKVKKYAILMTDGEFNTAFANVAAGSDPRNQSNRARSSAERHCAEMKKAGIEIFAVGFMLDKTAAKQVMKACASPDTGAIAHYYEAKTGTALDEAFKEIAANIERLTLVK